MLSTVLQQGIPTSLGDVLTRYGDALVSFAVTVAVFGVSFVVIYYLGRVVLVRLTERGLGAREFSPAIVSLGSSLAGIFALVGAFGNEQLTAPNSELSSAVVRTPVANDRPGDQPRGLRRRPLRAYLDQFEGGRPRRGEGGVHRGGHAPLRRGGCRGAVPTHRTGVRYRRAVGLLGPGRAGTPGTDRRLSRPLDPVRPV